MKRLIKLLIVFTILLSAATSCRKPYQEKIYKVVESSQTAFVLPLEGANKTNQGKMDSEAYLERNKVAAKRIEIPTRWHQTGRRSDVGNWIPTVRIIIVEREPVTRKWTGIQDDINVESSESIAFGIGVTVTASIPESTASKFLYNYSGKTLATVVNSDIKPFVQSVLTSEFGSRGLSKCQAERAEINKSMVDRVSKHFNQYGIEIKQIGIVGGFTYQSASIQTSIDEKFNSAQRVLSSVNEVKAANNFLKAAQAIRKQKEVANAEIMNSAVAEGIKSGKIWGNITTLILDPKANVTDIFAAKNINR